MKTFFYFSFLAVAAGFAYDTNQTGLCAALTTICLIILGAAMIEYLGKGKVS